MSAEQAGMPEETILVAAANILRTEATRRVGRVQERLQGMEASQLPTEQRIEMLSGTANDLGIAATAAKAADGIDDFLRETTAADIREKLT